jgi:hypothetical protein
MVHGRWGRTRFVSDAKKWLHFLGRLQSSTALVPYAHLINDFCDHLVRERGLSQSTVRVTRWYIAIVERTNERWFEVEVHRTAGEIALLRSGPVEAEAQLERALSIARSQKARSWELRAATSMARLWLDQGKQRAARDTLAPVYGWFTVGLETWDLQEARRLLDSLGS